MKKQQSGFTLIELIMVIVVLGILAAFAIPKFADLGGDARRAVLKGAYGSIQSASALAHSSFLAQGLAPLASGQKVKVEGDNVALVWGYPAGIDAASPGTEIGIATAAGLSSADFDIPTALTAGAITFSVKGASDSATCAVKYTPAANATTPAEVVIVSADGC